MTGPRKMISIVTCAYNEEACVDELARRLSAIFDSMPAYDFEVVAIENGSEDSTLAHLEAIARVDPRFRIIELARNFGFDGGLAAGLAHARGDAAVLMAADLQDPPEVIPDMIARWEAGDENVYGIVAQRGGTHWLRRANSDLFYWIIGKLGEQPIPAHARDFRLLDRNVYRAVTDLPEQKNFLRGLIAWTGFRSSGVEFEQPPRFGGSTKASSKDLGEFAIRAVFSHSLTPLRLLPVVGTALVIGSFFALVGITVNSIANGVPFPGFGTIIAVLILMFGILFCFLSVIGIYVGLIFEQVRSRPSFIVRRIIESE